MVPLKETPQLFRKCLTLQMAVDDRKLYVASKQSSRDPPFCLSNSAAVVSPLPAADTILHSFQHSVGRVLLKTCSCWLSACAAGSLGLAACVLWCAEQPDTFQMNPSMCQSLRCPRAWFPVGQAGYPCRPVQCCCSSSVSFVSHFAASASITDDLTVTFSVYFFQNHLLLSSST